MPRVTVSTAVAAALVLLLSSVLSVSAQAQNYFIPGQQRPAAAEPPPAPRPPTPAPRPPAAAPAPRAPATQILPAPPSSDPNAQLLEVALPPVPELPSLPRAASPPAAVIGVIGVPEVMRASTAAQQVDRVISERREKLNEDAQKEQANWRDLQQQLTAQRSTMAPEQVRVKERELQDRVTASQKQLRDRTRFIQEAAQVGVGQIERTLVAVIRQVAESHGMNLVLHRAQVALNVNDFDISEQVAEQLNKILPSVTIPPDGVSAATPVAPVLASPVSAPPAPAPAAGPRR